MKGTHDYCLPSRVGNIVEISIIIPVYNVEKLLVRCIESILVQSFGDFELILIDDGSKDRAGEICDEYADKDKRIKVFHQGNQGVSVARNKAINVAKGKYITFIDADDWVHEQYLEKMYTRIEHEQADVIVGRICRLNNKEDAKPVFSKKYDILNNREAIEYFGGLNDESFRAVLAKLVKTDIVKKKLFPEGRKWSEDTAVVYRWYFEANKIVNIDEKLYFYWDNPEGITNNKKLKVRLGEIATLEEQLAFFKKYDFSELYKKFLDSYIYNLSYQCKLSLFEYKDINLAQELKSKLKTVLTTEKGLNMASIGQYPYAYEVLYPDFMNLYWRIKAICNWFKV